MLIIKRKLRPAGNSVLIHKNAPNIDLFQPFSSKYYQSGTSSLAAAIIASIKIKSNIAATPEVIIPAYCCPDIISAIIYAKAKPIPVDLDADLPWMSLRSIKNNITDNTVSIVAVNFLGISERTEQISEICKTKNITLIEDSAQGFPLFNLEDYWRGDMIVLSFGRGKPVSLLEGGAVLTKNINYLDQLPTPDHVDTSLKSSLKYYIKASIYNFLIYPYIYNLLTLLPGINIGSTTFKTLSNQTEMHRSALKQLSLNIVAYKERGNLSLKLKQMLSSIDSPILIDLVKATEHNVDIPLLRYPILIKNEKTRNTVATQLESLGISLMYQTTLKNIDGVDEFLNKYDDINSNNFSKHLITIPTHTDLKQSDIEKIKFVLIENLHGK